MSKTLEQRIEIDWQAGKYQQVLRNLRKLSEDIAAETIVVVADSISTDNRLKLLEFLGDDLAGDGEVLSMLGL